MVHRHRAAGLHCNPGGSSSSNGVVSADKMQMPMPMPMQPQQPQAMYPMQPQHTGGFVQQQMPQQYVQGPPVAGFFQQAPTAAPLSSQTTGGSYIQVPVQQQPQLQQQMPMPQQQQQHQVPPPLNGAQQLYGSA